MTPAVSGMVPESIRARLIELRRAIHAEPELAFEERKTAEKLEQALADLGVRDVKRVAGTAVIARIPGTKRGAPTIALRGDIDALPIQEETGLPFASRTPGVMHACGHDVHATWAVGAAALLAAQPAAGDTIIVLQPAEEIGRGALAVLESGALDDVRMIFGGHVDRRFAVGQVVADAGPLAAASDSFEIDVVGRGAHAARPHEARDPIVASAAIILALQTIVARKLNPATPGVVTVAQIAAGTASNVIPDRATMRGTIRAVDVASRTTMQDELRRIAESVAVAHGVTAKVTFLDGTPPLVNGAEAAGFAREAATRTVGADGVVPLGTVNLAAEDFAFYLERMPGCFMRIGAREPKGEFVAAHSPRFHASEDSIAVGAAVLAECARISAQRLGA